MKICQKISRVFIVTFLFMALLICEATASVYNDHDWAGEIKSRHYHELKASVLPIATSFSGAANHKTIRVIVEYKNSSSSRIVAAPAMAIAIARMRTQGAIIHKEISRFNAVAMTVNATQLDALMADDQVLVLSEDKRVEPSLDISVPFIDATSLHQDGYLGAGQAVAILDTGIDASHAFFGGRIVEEACFSTGDNVNSFSLCPNGQNRQLGTGAGRDCGDRYSVSDCAHGTHVAGIAAGKNNVMTGVAPAANIVPVQIFTYSPNSLRLGAYTSDMLAAFDWLINDAHTQVAAVNMSLGGGSYTAYCDDAVPALTSAIQLLRSRGVATVIASGNDASYSAISWPGCISSAITVGASAHDQNILAWFSNTASMVDLLAPGIGINSAVPGGGYAALSGTSMATPHVTGAFALLRSLKPDASVDDIEMAMKLSGVPVAKDFANNNIGYSIPLISLWAAADLLSPDAHNLALNKPAFASSSDAANTVATNATDASLSTRWSSQYSDNEWIYIDLGQHAIIKRVLLSWESAYAKSYSIQISNDALNWTTLVSVTNGNGGLDNVKVSGAGRYVRMQGQTRATSWGYSLWDFKIYGNFDGDDGGTNVNKALHKPTVASSIESSDKSPELAVDGIGTTRWSSSYSDSQWIYVDLGAITDINRVKLNWETAYAKAYQVQVSNDASSWTTLSTVTNGDGGIDELSVSGSGRYLRILCQQRATAWGYSLWELEVYGGAAAPAPLDMALHQPVSVSSVESSSTNASLAVDGNDNTRWSSQYSDPQWIYVDLGNRRSMNRVVLKWEVAYARAYELQVSDDAVNWTRITAITNGQGGIETIPVSTAGRYLRMYGINRATSYGYSLWGFEVY